MIARIDEARSAGDTVGGVFEVDVHGLPVGLGSYVHWDAGSTLRWPPRS